MRLWMIGWRKFPSRNWTPSTIPSADQRSDPALVGERYEHCDQPGDRASADEGNEPSEKDEDGERERKRDAEDPEADADEEGIDEGDQCRAAHEAAEHPPGASARPDRSTARVSAENRSTIQRQSTEPSRRMK